MEVDDKEALVTKFKDRVRSIGESMPAEAAKTIEEELSKLGSLEKNSAEFNTTRNYLDWLTQVIGWGGEVERWQGGVERWRGDRAAEWRGELVTKRAGADRARGVKVERWWGGGMGWRVIQISKCILAHLLHIY